MSNFQKIIVAVLALLIILCIGFLGYWIGSSQNASAVASIQTPTSPSEQNQAPKPTLAPTPENTVKPEITHMPIITPTPTPQQDFLDNPENLHNLNLLLENYDFQGFLDSINTYIDSSNPEATDNAYDIKKLLTQIIDLLQNCDLRHDEFDDSYTIYYKDVDTISKSINIVPVIEDRMLHFRLGFKKSDWLFFDAISIKPTDGDNITKYFNSWDMQREVLHGGVLEYIDISFFDADLLQIQDSDSLTIRFINGDNDEYYEHEFSENELEACKTLIAIEQVLQKLVDLTFYKH